MSRRMRVATSLVLCVAALATLLASLIVSGLPSTRPFPDQYGAPAMAVAVVAAFVLVGAAITFRRPANSVGWILLVSGFFGGFLTLGFSYGPYALLERSGAVPGGAWAAWVAAWSFPLALGPVSTLLLLVFPDGRLPSPRWRPVLWFTVTMLAVWSLNAALAPGPLVQNAYANNPLWPASAEKSGIADLLSSMLRVVQPYPLLLAPWRSCSASVTPAGSSASS